MTIRYGKKLLLIMIAAGIAGCGESAAPPSLSLSGTVSGQAIVDHPDKPILVAVIRGGELNRIQTDPMEAIIAYIPVDHDQLTFRIDLTDKGLTAGDTVMLAAFVDMNYRQGLPYPDPGDFIGIYVNAATLSVGLQLQEGETGDIDIHIDREIYNFQARVAGTVRGDDTGNLILIAYAGEFVSSDFSTLNPSAIVGYRQMDKSESSLEYELPILPYGYDAPIENVFILAWLDVDRNGLMNTGDKIGYHGSSSGLPAPLTVLAGVNASVDIDFYVDITTTDLMDQPADYEPIFLKGTVSLSPAVPDVQAPVFLLVASGADLGQLFTDPLSAVAYFEKMPPAESSFSLDLSSTSLLPDSRIMVLALWDRDYIAGFPQPTPGDKIGIFQNKSQMSQDIRIADWPVDPVSAGWEFRINRRIYAHDASLTFQLESDGSVDLTPGEELIFLAVQKGGVDDQWHLLTPPGYQITDTDYTVGLQKTVVNAENHYTVDILPAIYEQVPVSEDPFTIPNVYLFVVLDSNRNGLPDTGEYVGFYWQSIWFFRYYYFPKTMNVVDGPHILDRTVLFSGMKL